MIKTTVVDAVDNNPQRLKRMKNLIEAILEQIVGTRLGEQAEALNMAYMDHYHDVFEVLAFDAPILFRRHRRLFNWYAHFVWGWSWDSLKPRTDYDLFIRMILKSKQAALLKLSVELIDCDPITEAATMVIDDIKRTLNAYWRQAYRDGRISKAEYEVKITEWME